MSIGLLALSILATTGPADDPPTTIRVPLSDSSEVDVVEVAARLAEFGRIKVERPSGVLRLPLEGRAAQLTLTLLADTLGRDAVVKREEGELVISLEARVFEPAGRADWERRVRELADRAAREIERRERYGFRARPSYRPDDPTRPTVCLIHGLNSSSGVFRHFFEPLEAAGYGLVTYDFPYNRDLDETSAAFARDWLEFRNRAGDPRPWSIAAHSMGSLLARSYVEDDRAYAGDVATLVLIAPPNHGSTLAQAQTLLQTVQSLRAMQGSRPDRPPGPARRRPGPGGRRHDPGESISQVPRLPGSVAAGSAITSWPATWPTWASRPAARSRGGWSAEGCSAAWAGWWPRACRPRSTRSPTAWATAASRW